MPLFLTIALPVPLRQTFTYTYEAGDKRKDTTSKTASIEHQQEKTAALPFIYDEEHTRTSETQETKETPLPQHPPSIGARVRVPFGSRKLIGVILECQEDCQFDEGKIKSIIHVLDAHPILPNEIIRLCRWAADYYHHPLGEVLSAALPQRFREGKTHEPSIYYQLTNEGKELPDKALKRAKNQYAIYQQLLSNKVLSADEIKPLGLSMPAVKALLTKGLVEKLSVDDTGANSTDSTNISTIKENNTTENSELKLFKEPPKTLTHEQAQALEHIRYHQYACYLVQGTTGSGKTELYMHIVARVLQAQQQALILIPEIGLSPQTVNRFRARFNVHTVELHSNIAEAARARNWQQAKTGEARIVIGTRLASLTPFNNLGVIIIDEEHDKSYKQQDGFRYSARDLSVFRAHHLGIPVILGSATPSLESLHNAQKGKYQKLILKQRAGGAKLPHIQTVDLKQSHLRGGLNEYTLDQLKQCLAKQQQALVFVNRRGYAPALICHSCGWSADCHACDVRMTFHQTPRHMRCHYCDHSTRVPSSCPSCGSKNLLTSGYGTEQIEQELAQLFPETPVIRIDRDSTRNKKSMENKLMYGATEQACIFVGTQMLAKGHHLPHLTLAIIADADQGLLSPDFRTLEHMGQLITQVAGRAGRGEQAGTVLLQTHRPDHPLLQALIQQGYPPFAENLLQQRQHSHLPPYWHMAIFRAESKHSDDSIQLLNAMAELCRDAASQGANAQILGPYPATIERMNGRYRFTLQVSTIVRSELQKILGRVLEGIDQHALIKKTRWSVDVNPVES